MGQGRDLGGDGDEKVIAKFSAEGRGRFQPDSEARAAGGLPNMTRTRSWGSTLRYEKEGMSQRRKRDKKSWW